VCVEPEQHEGLGLFGSCSIRDKRAWPIQTLRAGDISFVRPIRTLVHNQMICTLGLEGERKGPTGGQDSAVPAKCQAIGSDQRGPQLIPASRPECETNVLRMICVNWMEPRKCSASRQVSGFSPGLPWKKHAARVDDWLPTCYRTPTQAPLALSRSIEQLDSLGGAEMTGTRSRSSSLLQLCSRGAWLAFQGGKQSLGPNLSPALKQQGVIYTYIHPGNL
jgi:hypothetical protein